MPEIPISFLKGDAVDNRVDYRDQLPENMLGIARPIMGVDGYMWQQAGLEEFGGSYGNDRGGIWNERLSGHYRLSGNRFVEIDINGDYTELGIINGNLQAAMPYSFNTQAIVAQGAYYLYDPTNGFRQVTDVDVGNPIDATWIDGYYFFTDGETIYHTDIDDEESINPLKFATSEFSPDKTVGVGKTTDNKVIVFNRYTTEYFQNQANENFAFTRIPSRAIKYGLVATHLKCEIGGTWYFVGSGKEGTLDVYRLETGRPVSLASREVTKRLRVYSEDDLANQVMEARVFDGNEGFIIHLPNETLFFSVTLAQKVGVEMAWSLLTSPSANQYRAVNGIYDPRIDEWIYGDLVTNNLATLNDTIATQFGEEISCQLNTPFFYINSASIDEVNIETIPGFNTVDDATVFLSLSYDGVVWSQEISINYGSPGDYGNHFAAYRLGYVDGFVTMRLRWKGKSRMAFSRAVIVYA